MEFKKASGFESLKKFIQTSFFFSLFDYLNFLEHKKNVRKFFSFILTVGKVPPPIFTCTVTQFFSSNFGTLSKIDVKYLNFV